MRTDLSLRTLEHLLHHILHTNYRYWSLFGLWWPHLTTVLTNGRTITLTIVQENTIRIEQHCLTPNNFSGNRDAHEIVGTYAIGDPQLTQKIEQLLTDLESPHTL